MKPFIYLLTVLMLVSAVHAANIVQNPSFEDGLGGELPGWDRGPFFFGSTVTDDPGPQDGSRFAVTVCGHTGGSALCFLHPLQQNLATDGGTFTLSFWFDLGSSEGDDELGFSGLVVQWGDQIVLNIGAEEQADQGYQLATIPGLRGDAANGVDLEFFAFNTTDDGSVGIDNVSVIETDPPPAPTAPAPEPGTVLLCLGALGAALVFRRHGPPIAGYSTGA